MFWLVLICLALVTTAALLIPLLRAPGNKSAIAVLGVVVPLSAGLLYAAWGNPSLPDQPYAERLEHDPNVILAHTADTMKAALATNPSADGYRRLAELNLRRQAFADAATAEEEAIRLGARSSADWSDLGEMRMLETGGTITPKALSAFAAALTADARDPRARLYVGLAEAQTGHSHEAVAIWRDLEKDSRADAPWLASLREQIAATAKKGGFDADTIAPAPPSLESLKAALAAMQKAMKTKAE